MKRFILDLLQNSAFSAIIIALLIAFLIFIISVTFSEKSRKILKEHPRLSLILASFVIIMLYFIVKNTFDNNYNNDLLKEDSDKTISASADNTPAPTATIIVPEITPIPVDEEDEVNNTKEDEIRGEREEDNSPAPTESINMLDDFEIDETYNPEENDTSNSEVENSDYRMAVLNCTKVYLHLSGISGQSEYDFNVLNKVSGSKYAWVSINEDVVVVDEATGLTTATGVGSTKVTVVITLKNGEEMELSADVVVRDNIETVAVSNAPSVALTVGQEYDFNRSFVTEAGSTTKTSSITLWIVDKYTATINESGRFIANEVGEYRVTVLTFQSTAKYEAWLVSGDSNLILDSDEITVIVEDNTESTNSSLPPPYAIYQSTDNFNNIYIEFSNKLDLSSAEDVTNYSISGISIIDSNVISNTSEYGATVVLDIAEGSIYQTGNYLITISGIKGYNNNFTKMDEHTFIIELQVN